jgi:hypothetical protein
MTGSKKTLSLSIVLSAWKNGPRKPVKNLV